MSKSRTDQRTQWTMEVASLCPSGYRFALFQTDISNQQGQSVHKQRRFA